MPEEFRIGFLLESLLIGLVIALAVLARRPFYLPQPAGQLVAYQHCAGDRPGAGLAL
jgi:hypothetical protein